jgi:peptidoglycan/LPS O-acetylase OafA/YrhL
MLFVLWKSKMLEKKSMIRVMMLLTVVFSIVGFGIKLDVIYQFHAYLRPLVIFVVGMFYYLYEDKIPLDFRLLVIAVIGLIVCVIAGVSDFGMVTFFPYILSFIMFMKHQVSESFAKTGELSYVMYLVAFPIQQTIVRYAGDISVCLLFVSASVICIMVSILGYNCVEKPAGKWIMDRVRKV